MTAIRIILNLIGIGALSAPVFMGVVMFAWAFPTIFFWCAAAGAILLSARFFI